MSSSPLLQRAVRVAALCAVAALIVLSWLPRGTVPRTGAPGSLEHVFAYAGVGLLAAAAVPPVHRRWLGLAFVGLAAVLEAGQIWIPGRVAQFKDFAASCAGAVVGLALMGALDIRLRKAFGSPSHSRSPDPL